MKTKTNNNFGLKRNLYQYLARKNIENGDEILPMHLNMDKVNKLGHVS